MITIILSLIIVFLLIALGASIYYNYRFGTYIISIEDTLNDAISTYENTVKTFEDISKLEFFFEDENMKRAFKEAKEDLSICKFEIQRMTDKFLALSKHKYIIEESEENKK